MLGAEGLKPISWRIWAGEMEREAKEKGAGESGGIFGGLEDGRRLGFVDIRVSKIPFSWFGGTERERHGLLGV